MAKSKPVILFICEGNKVRSQMAEAFYRQQGGLYQPLSAGTLAENGDPPSQLATSAMDEIGIDISSQTGRRLTQEMVDKADKIIIFPTTYMPSYASESPKAEFWENADPYYYPQGDKTDFMRRTRDDIKQQVEQLIAKEEVKTNEV